MRRTPHFTYRKIHLNHFIKLSLTVLSDPRWDLPSQMLPAAATRRWLEKGLCSSHSSTKLFFFSPGIFQGSGIAGEKKVQVCGQDLRPGEHTISSPATAPVCRMAEQPVPAGLLGKGETVKEKEANQTLYFMKNA